MTYHFEWSFLEWVPVSWSGPPGVLILILILTWFPPQLFGVVPPTTFGVILSVILKLFSTFDVIFVLFLTWFLYYFWSGSSELLVWFS